jgi:hypothetical protein
MTDPSLREALLRQDPGSSIGTQIETLRGLVAADDRRARRLIMGTIAVWGLWTAMIIAYLLYGFFTAAKVPPLPAGAIPAPVPMSPGPQMVVSGIGAFLLMLLGFLCLPAVVMLPWLLMFLGRRSAGMGQVRTSLASIEAQLNLLSRTTGTPPTDSPSPATG